MIEVVERLVASVLRRRRWDPSARPDPRQRPGADLLPEIRHIVVLMMENHSYDNYLGMMQNRGDGFTRDQEGLPTATNPASAGDPVRAFRQPGTTQEEHVPTQSWTASHTQYDNGANDGFVRSIEESGLVGDAKVAMRYWQEEDIPFYYGLARTFPVADRWFGSCLGPTLPNRRFLVAGTANGLVDDEPSKLIDYPETGTLFDLLKAYGVSWRNYYSSPRIHWWTRRWKRLLAEIQGKVQFTADVFPLGFFTYLSHCRSIKGFLGDAAAGRLPAVSIVDPDFATNSEENPKDIRLGEAFSASIVNAVMAGKGWPHTLLVWTYDEHGGYYDHVAPPGAVAPDDVPPEVPARGGGDNYEHLGFRVPAVIVSPYAKRDYVVHRTYDHTSILKTIERKWNLPPLTRRDAAAEDLLDALDLSAPPAFLTPPTLPAPGLGTS